jgi:outer membrane protein TolC
MPAAAIGVRSANLAVGLTQRLRNGITLAPEVTVTGTRYLSEPRIDVTQMSAHLKATVALLKDRGGDITAAPEQAASFEHRASMMDARQAQAELILQTAVAYWTYLAGERKLAVLVSAEERAQRTVAETGALVKADERTGSDLVQAQGYFSARRAARLGAEQQRLDAGRRLILLVGLRWPGASRMAHAATDFPQLATPPTAEILARWTTDAFGRRPDLAAANLRGRSAGTNLDAARSDMSARLDLSVSVGYTGQSNGLGDLGELHRQLPGADATMSLTYQLPLRERGARGRLAQAIGVVRQRETALSESARRIEIGIAAALEMLTVTQQALREATEAVRLTERTVEIEKRKFKLGSSTLFSVNQAEEALTSALLSQIDETLAFANALATLRFETASLSGPSAALAGQLTSLPD